jgi:hypothetical protein
MHEEAKKLLREGRPWSCRISTGELLVISPLTEGLFVAVESQGGLLLDGAEVPTVWDLVGAGVSLALAPELYKFLAEMIHRPRRRVIRHKGGWITRPDRTGLSAHTNKPKTHE